MARRDGWVRKTIVAVGTISLVAVLAGFGVASAHRSTARAATGYGYGYNGCGYGDYCTSTTGGSTTTGSTTGSTTTGGTTTGSTTTGSTTTGSTTTGTTGATTTGSTTTGTTGSVGGTGTTVICRIPNLVKKKKTLIRKALAAAHCTLGKLIKRYSSSKRGLVTKVSPPAGRRFVEGYPVSVVVSLGPKPKRTRH